MAVMLVFAVTGVVISSSDPGSQLATSPQISTPVTVVTETYLASAIPTVVWGVSPPSTGHFGQEESGAVVITNTNNFITEGYALVVTFTTTSLTCTNCFTLIALSDQALNLHYAQYMNQCTGFPCPGPTTTTIRYYVPLVLPPNGNGPTVITISIHPSVTGTFTKTVSIASDPGGSIVLAPAHQSNSNSTSP